MPRLFRLTSTVIVSIFILTALFYWGDTVSSPTLAASVDASSAPTQVRHTVLTATNVITDAETAAEEIAPSLLDEYRAMIPDPLPPRTDPPVWVTVGDPFTYTFTITNVSQVPATGVIFLDSLPESVTLESVTATRGDCAGNPDIACELGDLGPGETAKIFIVVAPNATGLISNTGRVGSNEIDPNRENNRRTKLHLVLPASPPLAQTSPVTSTTAVTTAETITPTAGLETAAETGLLIYLPVVFKE